MSKYKELFRSSSIVGMVQVFGLIASVIRSKVVSLLFGASGLGFFSILQSTQLLVVNISSFGLPLSGVKEISGTRECAGEAQVSKVVATLNFANLILGGFALIFCFLFSGYLSKTIFGTSNNIPDFYFLGLSIFFTQLYNSLYAVHQGLRSLKVIAYSGILSNAVSLAVSLPIYFAFGEKSIAFSFLISALASFLCIHFIGKRHIDASLFPRPFSLRETLKAIYPLLKLGIVLNLATLLAQVVSYFTRLYITNTGSLADLGFYSATYSIVYSYTGIFFTALATEYFPRLVASAKKEKALINDVNKQIEFSLLILFPLMCLFVGVHEYIIKALYSNEFIVIKKMLVIAGIGNILRAVSWALAYMIIARGSSRLFFYNELVANLYTVALNIYCYRAFGLNGLSVAFLISNALYACQLYIVTKKVFRFSFSGLNSLLLLLSLVFYFFLYVLTFTEAMAFRTVAICFIIITSGIISGWLFSKKS